jgi:hypothetical protein
MELDSQNKKKTTDAADHFVSLEGASVKLGNWLFTGSQTARNKKE